MQISAETRSNQEVSNEQSSIVFNTAKQTLNAKDHIIIRKVIVIVIVVTSPLHLHIETRFGLTFNKHEQQVYSHVEHMELLFTTTFCT